VRHAREHPGRSGKEDLRHHTLHGDPARQRQDSIISGLVDLQERIGLVEGRMQKGREQIQMVQQQLLDEEETAVAVSVFDSVWEALTPREQARVIGLLVERVDYDGSKPSIPQASRRWRSSSPTSARSEAHDHPTDVRVQGPLPPTRARQPQGTAAGRGAVARRGAGLGAAPPPPARRQFQSRAERSSNEGERPP